MPSPFPGMDPYLEEPSLWPDVHHELISEIRAELSRLLRPKYFVRVEDRVYLTNEFDAGRFVLIPNVRVTMSTRREPATVQPFAAGGVSLVEPVEIVDTTMIEIRESRLEVLDRLDRQVVTVIEILSPSNKIDGSRGRESYLQKREDVLQSPSHFVEIDLLRSSHTLRLGRLWPSHPYAVQVSRAENRPKWKVWPIRLSDRLPQVDIPLSGGDPDAPLDMQQILNRAYERADYDADIDYTQPPIPPLSEDDARWAREIIAAARSQRQ